MPIYDTRCPKCGTVERDVVQPSTVERQRDCAICLVPVERVWLGSAAVHIFHADFYEHAADEMGRVPYFSSRQKYKSYLKENGMYSDYVEGR